MRLHITIYSSLILLPFLLVVWGWNSTTEAAELGRMLPRRPELTAWIEVCLTKHLEYV